MSLIKNKSSEIVLIAPSEILANKANKIVKNLDENIDIHIASLDNAYLIVKQLIENGAKVIISRKGTKAVINKYLNTNVVGIDNTLADYIKVMEDVKKRKIPVAFFTYDEITEDIKSMCHLLNIDVTYYCFKDERDCEKCVLEAIKNGIKLGIGGSITEKYAKKYNLEHVIPENSEESILNSIKIAKQVLIFHENEIKKIEELTIKLETYQAILNFSHDAIIAINERGCLDVVNPVAEKILKKNASDLIGKKVEKFVPNFNINDILKTGSQLLNQIINIDDTIISTNQIPITINGKIKGVVATFQDVKVIQDNEKKIRMKLHNKGFNTKYIFDDIKGESKQIKYAINIAKSYANTNATVLIFGETGTGKELFAQSIHNMSLRKNEPFVAVNCATLSKNLLESELFGYDDGAFTGAIKGGKAGLFELAHKGTLFLDEIGEIDLEMQVQLLRVLQEKEVRRLGGNSIIPIDVRIIAATNKDLKNEILKNKFREDLYYRLNILSFVIPPLRKRKEDIKELCTFFIKKYVSDNIQFYQNNLYKIIDTIYEYDWPGNIRELQNFIERAVILLSQNRNYNEIIENIDLSFLSPITINKEDDSNLNNWEKEKIIECLKNNNLSLINTANHLGISRTTLWRKMRQYNIKQ